MIINIEKNKILAPYTSWQIGGPAEFFCAPGSLDELKEALHEAQKQSWPVTVLGGGSNVLISDHGVSGLVIHMKNLVGVEAKEDQGFLKITAWAGTGKSELLRIFIKQKLAPALFLAGLPGDIGGGFVMNAGVAENFVPREFGEIVEWVEVLRPNSNEVVRLKHDDMKWIYRHSHGWQPGIVVRVGLQWPLQPQEDILDRVKSANKIRLSKQPLDLPSCGSVFVNPPGHKVAQLIDQCGLKGTRRGDAEVSNKHANFIVNLGKATAVNVRDLIEFVKQTVKEKTSVDIQTEVVFLGRF